MSPDSAAALAALDTAHRQLLTALWLAAGMLCGAASTALLALGWRRCALLAGLGYGITLCFVPVGHARVLGPGTAAAAAFGLLRPASRSKARPEVARHHATPGIRPPPRGTAHDHL